jgi:hypothetical protein
MKYLKIIIISLCLFFKTCSYAEEIELSKHRLKSKMFRNYNIDNLNYDVDKFIKDKKIIEIKFSSNAESTFGISHSNYSVIIIYEENK